MAGEPPHPPLDIDVRTPSPSRIYNYLLGGLDNWYIDRAAAEKLLDTIPETQAMAQASREFLLRAVDHLAASGTSRFLDLGCGLPMRENVHNAARRHLDPTVVYVDHDPVTITHGRAQYGDTHTHLLADARDVDHILNTPEVRRLLSPREPVGLLMSGLIPYFSDADNPAATVARYAAALPSGSHLVVSHLSNTDADPDLCRKLLGVRRRWATPLHFRPDPEIQALLPPDFTLLPPGITEVENWRPTTPPETHFPIRNLAYVARKN